MKLRLLCALLLLAPFSQVVKADLCVDSATGRYITCSVATISSDSGPLYEKTSFPPQDTVTLTGADPTGVADSSSALQTAMTAAAAGGKNLYISPGTYIFSNNVTCPTGKTFVVADPGTVTFKGGTAVAAGHNAVFVYATVASTSCIFHGITFDGNASAIGRNYYLFSCSSSTKFIIEDGVIQNNGAGATDNSPFLIAALSSCNYSGFRRNRFTNIGWWFQHTSGTTTSNPLISYNTAGTANFFDDNEVDNVGGTPALIGAQVAFSFSRNTVLGTNDGWINSGSGGGTAAFYGSQSATNYGTRVNDNYVTGMTGNNIDIDCGSGYTVTGNTIKNAGGAGIALSSNTGLSCSLSDVTVTGNTVKNSYQALNYSGSYAVAPALTGAIWLGDAAGSAGTISNVVIADNVLADDQGGSASQVYGVQKDTHITLSNVRVAPSNVYYGNTTGNTSTNLIAQNATTQYDIAPYAGTGTTSLPIVYYLCPGAPAPSSWSTSGTIMGFNVCSAFAGNVIEVRKNGGAYSWQLTNSGFMTAANGATLTGGTVGVNVSSNDNTNINTGTSTGTLALGGTTAGNNVNFASVSTRFGNIIYASVTAPTISAGFNTSGNSVTAASTAAFQVTVGTSTATTTGALTMPAATNGWACSVTDVTTPASHNVVQTASATNSVTVTDYSRTTGIAQNMVNSDKLNFVCGAF